MAGLLNGWRGWLRAGLDDRGQSLVEVALMVPILLLIVLGTVDVGRIFALKAAVTNAAREAAIHAARDPQATRDQVCQRARDELGIGKSPAPCSDAPVVVDCTRDGASCGNDTSARPPIFQTNGGDVSVTITYQTSLLSAYLIGQGLPSSPKVSATASAPALNP